MQGARRTTLTRPIELVLAISSLAPVVVVLAVVGYRTAKTVADRPPFLALGLGGVVLMALGAGLVALAGRAGTVQQLKVTEHRAADKDVFGFVLAYIAPAVLASASTLQSIDPVGLLVASGCAILVLWRTNSLHVNPLLAIMGYRFIEIQDQAGMGGLLLTRDRTAGRLVKVEAGYIWEFDVIRLTDAVWLHVPPRGSNG